MRTVLCLKGKFILELNYLSISSMRRMEKNEIVIGHSTILEHLGLSTSSVGNKALLLLKQTNSKIGRMSD